MQPLQNAEPALLFAIVGSLKKLQVAKRACYTLQPTCKFSRNAIARQVADKIAPRKATITRCDLSPRFFCIDATLLCKFESDKI